MVSYAGLSPFCLQTWDKLALLPTVSPAVSCPTYSSKCSFLFTKGKQRKENSILIFQVNEMEGLLMNTQLFKETITGFAHTSYSRHCLLIACNMLTLPHEFSCASSGLSSDSLSGAVDIRHLMKPDM